MFVNFKFFVLATFFIVLTPLVSAFAQDSKPRQNRLIQDRMTMGNQSPSIVIECENLLKGRMPARATAGQLSAQGMQAFGKNWSGNSQLFWQAEKVGDRLKVPISVRVAGTYEIVGVFTKAADYGSFRVVQDRNQLGSFDGYAPSVRVSDPVSLGKIRLQAGQNSIDFVVTGKNRKSSGFLVGLDKLTLSKGGSALKPQVVDGNKLNPNARLRRGVTVVGKPLDAEVMARLPKRFFAVRKYKVPPMTVRSGGTVPTPTVDLRPFIARNQLYIRDQGNRDTCSVFATTFLIEYTMTKAYGKGFADFSEEFLNGAGNMASGKTDDGDFFYVLDNGYQKYGICMEIFMPYQATMADPPNANQQKLASTWKRMNSDFIKPWDNSKGVTDAQLNKAIGYLDQGLPVASGLWWPKDGFFTVNNVHGVDIMADPGKPNMADGHSVALVGYRKSTDFPGGGYFVFRNSWGTDFGDRGYGYFSFEYVKKYANDLLAYQKPAE